MNKFSAIETYRRMAEFVVESGVTDPRQITTKISTSCGVSFQAAVKWKEGATKSVTMPPINQFCEKYGANPDYISTGRMPRTRGGSASEEEIEFLRILREATPEGRLHLLQTARLVDTKGKQS